MESSKFDRHANKINSSNDTMPIRCLLWGGGNVFRDYYHVVKYYETLGDITVYGVTSNDSLYDTLGGYRFIHKKCIDYRNFDAVIIMSTQKNLTDEIITEAQARGIPNERIIPCRVLLLYGFNIKKYLKIKKSVPSIFAPNCWAGITYNSLGLQFKSPFINMFENHDDYLSFLNNPEYYLSQPLRFKEMAFETNLKRDFPVVSCDDILLNFNHYETFEEAETAWNRRKERIDWNNLYVMFYDEDKGRIDQFSALPYKNKVCFTPMDYDQECVVTINYRVNEQMKNIPFWQIVNGMASGRWPFYDTLDLLLYNKITPIATYKS